MSSPGPLGVLPAARVVAAREVWVTLRDKAFMTSTLVTLLLVLGAVLVPALLSGGGPDERDVAVVDASGAALVEQADDLAVAVAGEDGDPSVRLTAVEVGGREEAETAVRDGDAALAVLPGADGVELVGLDSVPSDAADALASAASALRAAEVAEELGATDDQVAALQPAPLAERTLEDVDPMVASFVATAFGMLFFFTVVGFGTLLAQRVTEEKQSRVVELLVAAVPVRALLVGKVLGVGALALGQVVLVVAVAGVGAAVSGQGQLMQLLASSSGWFVLFFLAGFLLLACLFAAAGAMAPRAEDLQATTGPLNMAVTLPFFASIFVAERGTWLTVLSYFPLSAPLSMPRRLLLDDVAWWEPLLALALVLGSAAVLVLVGARLYERSLLRSGGRVSWRAALARR